MDRTVNISHDFRAAEKWDIRQQVEMTPQMRMQIAAELKRRAYPPPVKDVRECRPEK
jgi:hypothetical protein